MSRKKYCLIGEITDFDYHGFWGDYCSPKSLKEFLDGLSAGEEAEIEINSPGGSVIMGIEMANAIKNSKAKLVAHVTGIAASMASVIACACSEIVMEEASFLMIHDPWSYAEGNAEEMRKTADRLDQMKAVIMSFYRGKFDRTEEQIAALMSDETWYTGNECVENGLKCTVVKSDVRAAASIVGHHFGKIPEAAAKFLDAKEVTDEGKAEIEAAKAKAKGDAGASATAAPAPDQGAATPPKSSTGNNSDATRAAAAQADGNAAAEGDWENRYKGASKKINELNDSLKAKDAEIAALKKSRDEANKKVNDFNDQVKASGYEDLAALTGAVSTLKTDLEKSGQDLAQAREQLDHMKETRDLLTGHVLTQTNTACKYKTFADAVDDLGFAEAARQFPELRASYRAKKNK